MKGRKVISMLKKHRKELTEKLDSITLIPHHPNRTFDETMAKLNELDTVIDMIENLK